MGYIEKNLISGEQVLYRTRLHSIAVIFPLLIGLVVAVGGFVCLYVSMANERAVRPMRRCGPGQAWR